MAQRHRVENMLAEAEAGMETMDVSYEEYQEHLANARQAQWLLDGGSYIAGVGPCFQFITADVDYLFLVGCRPAYDEIPF